VISISKLSYTFDGGTALHFPSFQVARGEHMLLLGQSGCGKTTLLHLAGGLRRNYTGSIQVANTELSSLSQSALDRFRGENIGFIFQRNHLIPALTVYDNLRLAPYLAGKQADGQRIDHVLKRLGLESQRTRRIHVLSQGQAQRVAIARAVLNRPAILFADEPTSALDDMNCSVVIDLLLEVAGENNAALVVATHDRRLGSRIEKQIHL
jgi:ABC-type lipoprotein export system ATPase subunit